MRSKKITKRQLRKIKKVLPIAQELIIDVNEEYTNIVSRKLKKGAFTYSRYQAFIGHTKADAEKYMQLYREVVRLDLEEFAEITGIKALNLELQSRRYRDDDWDFIE